MAVGWAGRVRRPSRLELACVAFLVNGFHMAVSFAGFKLHRFAADRNIREQVWALSQQLVSLRADDKKFSEGADNWPSPKWCIAGCSVAVRKIFNAKVRTLPATTGIFGHVNLRRWNTVYSLAIMPVEE